MTKQDTFQLPDGDRVYTFRELPATKGVVVDLILAKVLSEPLAKLAKAKLTDGASKDEISVILGAAFSDALGSLAANLTESDLLRVMGIVFSYVGIEPNAESPRGLARICTNDEPAGIDGQFTGRKKELWQVFIAAMRFTFADVFPEGLSLSALAKGQGPLNQSNPPTSTGGSAVS
jgi:hypothetical protein